MFLKRPVCIIGTGYVGMACAIGLADLGWSVRAYDVLVDRIERLRLGIPPYREPGIGESLREHISTQRIVFSTDLALAASDSDVIIIAVGTPARGDGSADLSAVHTAIERLSALGLTSWPTIVIRSTVPPGTCDELARSVEDWADLVYAPEFLREGSAVPDFLNPDRIIVGCTHPTVAVRYLSLLEPLQRPIVFTTRCNAELIKICSNAYLAMKISFANEVANVCDAIGGTSDDVLRGIGYDRRIGGEFLQPGIGFGGPCFEKDVRSIANVASRRNAASELFAATLRINDAQPMKVVAALGESLGSFVGAKIGIWGLAFKAGTDDTRDSIAVRIVEEIARRGARMVVYDPAVSVAPLPVGSRLVATALEATHADALLVLTDWSEFARIDPMDYARNLARGIVFDGRNVLDADRVVAAGLSYGGVGRGLRASAVRAPVACTSA